MRPEKDACAASLALQHVERELHRGFWSLPYEIIRHIFLLAKPDNHADGRHWAVSVPGVCKFWRDVALGCPHLWTTVSLRWSHPLAATFLDRSADLPLDVDVDLERIPYSNLVLLHRHFPRVRSLVVRGGLCWGYPVRELFGHYTPAQGAPILEELVVEALTVGSYELPLNAICGTTTPRLRKICLSPTIPAAPALPFIDPGAESLHLAVALPIARVVPALKRMRRLRSFVYTRRRMLHDAVDLDSASDVSMICNLPHLEHLVLNDVPCSEAVEMLHNLTAPRLASGSIHVTRNPHDRTDVFGPHLVATLKHCAHTGTVLARGLSTQELTVVFSASGLVSSVEILPHRGSADRCSNAPYMRISDETLPIPAGWDMCSALFGNGGVRTVRFEDCVLPVPLNRRWWCHFLSTPAFDAVQTVEFRLCSESQSPVKFFEALASDSHVGHPRTPLLPSLRRVVIVRRHNVGGEDLALSALVDILYSQRGIDVVCSGGLEVNEEVSNRTQAKSIAIDL